MNGSTRKLLVCGAFSSGKTTLVEMLVARLRASGRSVVTCPDVARSCPLPLNRDQTSASSIWLVSEQVRRELEAVNGRPDYVLCDRGVPDILSHQALAERRGSEDLLTPLVAFARAWVRTYDEIFRTSVDHSRPIAQDGLRSASGSYRRELDESLLQELEAARVAFQTLSGNPGRDVASILGRCERLRGPAPGDPQATPTA